MTAEAALYEFWNNYLTFYEENSVPVDAKFPYGTYQVVVGKFGETVSMAVSLYYASDSWLEINEKAREIVETIGDRGFFLDVDKGKIWLKLGNPKSQNMPEQNQIKRKHIGIQAECLTAD